MKTLFYTRMGLVAVGTGLSFAGWWTGNCAIGKLACLAWIFVATGAQIELYIVQIRDR